jgi:hypothetical protein
MYTHLFQFHASWLKWVWVSFCYFQSIWTSCSQPSGYNDHRNIVRKSTSWHSKNCPVIDLSVSVHQFWESWSVLPGQNVPFSERFWLSSSPVQFLGEPVWLVHSELKDKTKSPLTEIQVHTDPFYVRYGKSGAVYCCFHRDRVFSTTMTSYASTTVLSIQGVAWKNSSGFFPIMHIFQIRTSIMDFLHVQRLISQPEVKAWNLVTRIPKGRFSFKIYQYHSYKWYNTISQHDLYKLQPDFCLMVYWWFYYNYGNSNSF